MYEDDEYEEYEAYENAVGSFVRRMLLVTVFNRLQPEFTKEQFKKSFGKTFKSIELDDEDLEDAFEVSMDLEIVEEIKKGKFVFNGIALQSDEYH